MAYKIKALRVNCRLNVHPKPYNIKPELYLYVNANNNPCGPIWLTWNTALFRRELQNRQNPNWFSYCVPVGFMPKVLSMKPRRAVVPLPPPVEQIRVGADPPKPPENDDERTGLLTAGSGLRKTGSGMPTISEGGKPAAKY